jgi:hypothetical protein
MADDAKSPTPLSSTRDFVVAAKRSTGPAALGVFSNDGEDFIASLRTYSGIDVEILGSLNSRRDAAPLTAAGTPPDTLLIRMDAEKGTALCAQSMQPASAVWFEPNRRLAHFGDFIRSHIATASFLDGYSAGKVIEIVVKGHNDQLLAGASVTLHGYGLPLTQVTDDDGVVKFGTAQAFLSSLAGIVVDPPSMHWSRVIRTPSLSFTNQNVIRLTSFLEHKEKLGAQRWLSWGVARLRGDTPSAFDGAGVKVGVVDTGCDASHDYLSHVTTGFDFDPSASGESWRVDEGGHGTHCAGVIGARPGDALPVTGLAPGADIRVYKVFPSGTFFTLAAAIDRAIADGVDILNMSLGSSEISNFLVDRLASAREAGIACIVAAGNSGDEVKFPANLASVIAVSALGYSPIIPGDSVSGNTFNASFATTDGYFSPNFTCHGASIDFTAPGVGVISKFPNNAFKAMDGTSMAAPHVAGLSALYLAHDPLLKNIPRSAARVDALFARLQLALTRFPFGDRVGAGMPGLGIAKA